MAETPELREQAQLMRDLKCRVQRLETRRPLRGHVPGIAWGMAGPLDVDVKFPWLWVSIDPGGDGRYPEHKQILGFEGRIDSGEVGIYWTVDDDLIDDSFQTISSSLSSNRLDLPIPYVFANSDDGGAWLRPVFDYVSPTDDDVMLSCVPIFETVPV